LGAALAFLVTGFLLRGERAWQGWAVYWLIASLATVVLVAITIYTFSPSTPPTAQLGGTCAGVQLSAGSSARDTQKRLTSLE
jgi:hypothetical protein